MLGKNEKLIHPDSECWGLMGSNKKKRGSILWGLANGS